MPKTIAEYRLLPYHRRIERLQEGNATIFLAKIEEIPWIRIHGSTPWEAFLRLDEMFDDCIAAMLEAGDEVPEPEAWPDVVQGRPALTRTLAAALAAAADRIRRLRPAHAPEPEQHLPDVDPWADEARFGGVATMVT